MDNLYRFGEIEVVCEGYDYAEDPYITKGSCGLEYTLEYTKEGNIAFCITCYKLITILYTRSLGYQFIYSNMIKTNTRS